MPDHYNLSRPAARGMFALLAGTLLGLTGCGDDATDATAGPPDCELIDVETVRSLLGDDFRGGDVTDDSTFAAFLPEDFEAACDFGTPGDRLEKVSSLTVMTFTGGQATERIDQFENGDLAEPIDGIGDRAYAGIAESDTGGGPALRQCRVEALAGSTGVSVRIRSAVDADLASDATMCREIAATILDGLM